MRVAGSRDVSEPMTRSGADEEIEARGRGKRASEELPVAEDTAGDSDIEL